MWGKKEKEKSLSELRPKKSILGGGGNFRPPTHVKEERRTSRGNPTLLYPNNGRKIPPFLLRRNSREGDVRLRGKKTIKWKGSVSSRIGLQGKGA